MQSGTHNKAAEILGLSAETRQHKIVGLVKKRQRMLEVVRAQVLQQRAHGTLIPDPARRVRLSQLVRVDNRSIAHARIATRVIVVAVTAYNMSATQLVESSHG